MNRGGGGPCYELSLFFYRLLTNTYRDTPFIIRGGSRGGARGPRVPPLFLDQTEARGAEKDFGDSPPLPPCVSGSG